MAWRKDRDREMGMQTDRQGRERDTNVNVINFQTSKDQFGTENNMSYITLNLLSTTLEHT